jgi:uncharacterized membrane protein
MQNMNGKTALGMDNNLGALICYVGNIICGIGGLIYSIIVITQDKTNKVPRFHAFQSLLMSAVSVVVGIVIGVPMYILLIASALAQSTILSLLGMLFGLVFLVWVLAFLFFWVMSAIKAFNGEVYKVPFIGNLAEKWSN